MKILVLTDIHAAYDTAESILRRVAPDVLIIGGDLATAGVDREAGQALSRSRSHVPALFCVAGNLDLPGHDELFARIDISLNGRGVRLGDVGFCEAFGAPLSRLRTPYELPEVGIERRLRAGDGEVEECRIIILAPHAPPFGTHVDILHLGIHAGSSAVREVIEDRSPDVVVCGHIHQGRGEDVIGKTKIVCCG